MYLVRSFGREVSWATLPNLLSVMRVALIYPIWMLLQRGMVMEGFGLILVAFFTDWLDGRLARKSGSATVVGSILDPVADKLLVMSFMAFFAYKGELNMGYFVVAFARDFLQLMSVPVLIGWKKIFFKVEPRMLPKVATGMKFGILGMLFLLMLGSVVGVREYLLPAAMVVSGVMEVYILVTYFRRFVEIYKGKHDTFE